MLNVSFVIESSLSSTLAAMLHLLDVTVCRYDVRVYLTFALMMKPEPGEVSLDDLPKMLLCSLGETNALVGENFRD